MYQVLSLKCRRHLCKGPISTVLLTQYLFTNSNGKAHGTALPLKLQQSSERFFQTRDKKYF